MKTKVIFAVALAATVTLASCSKEDTNPVDTKEKTSVRLIVSDGMADGGSRAIGDAETAQNLAFRNGMVYFTNDAGDIYDSFKIVTASPGEGEVMMSVGPHVFEDITAAATRVHIVGNKSGLPTAGNVTNVLATVTDIYDATNQSIANVVLYGGQSLVKTDPDNYTAAVSVQPIAARIEIAQFTGGADITAYKVAGIYINNFYKQTTVTGAVKASADLQYNGEAAFAQYDAPSTAYPAGMNGITYDAAGWSSVAKVAKPAAGVWAYNLFAPTSGVFPHIVIKFSDLTTQNNLTGDKFITVTGFETSGGQPVTFTGGKIYKITDFTFVESDLDEKPEMKKVKATVTVSYVNWTTEPVKPIH